MAQATIEIEKITVPYNPRTDFSKVEEIAESMSRVGLLNPIVVRKMKDGTLVLVDGNQRLKAMQKLKQTHIAANVLDIPDDQIANEAQMVANLMRSDLLFMEKARGFAHLMNDKAKYNEKVIATRFGLKEAVVKKLVKFAKAIDPKCDAIIHEADRLDMDDVEILCAIPREHQLKVLKLAADGRGFSDEVFAKCGFFKLDFSDVFSYEKAKADGKIGFAVKWNSGYEAVYTADKAFYEETKKAHEAELAKKGRGTLYGEAEGKRKAVSEATAEKQKEERKKLREKQKKVKEEAYAEMVKALPVFIGKRSSKEYVLETAKRWATQLSTDDCRHLLRAFGIEFKSDLMSDGIKKLVWENIISKHIKDEVTAFRVFEFTAIRPIAGNETDTTGFKAWLKKMEA